MHSLRKAVKIAFEILRFFFLVISILMFFMVLIEYFGPSLKLPEGLTDFLAMIIAPFEILIYRGEIFKTRFGGTANYNLFFNGVIYLGLHFITEALGQAVLRKLPKDIKNLHYKREDSIDNEGKQERK